MNKKKLPIFILLIVFILFSAKTFFGKGLENGVENWRFYASLFGLLIAVSFLFVFLKSLKKTN
ncbi:hypothetical protein [Olleya namhaensis]|uniref:Uncharacterized protein n=1 Tax=Olleya namhaensis TaxID=1144750 RepID=A0A1I3PNW8_9FLAO|nr:hypothetical protein [Olleya namhaensis]SFJ23248.1 hypothetical protein SAMN05443431_105205 [Olleya namhaensis]